MVIKMGKIVEACNEDLPCLAAICYCYGGGMVGPGGEGLGTSDVSCDTYVPPCTGGEELCSQCYSENGCPGGSQTTGGSRGETTCERKNGNAPIVCRPGGRDQG